MKIIPWVITLCLLLAAAVAWWGGQSGHLPPPPEQVPPPHEQFSPPESIPIPPPQPTPDETSAILVPPEGFPKSHQGFSLESVKEEEAVDGVQSYFVARYLAEDDSEISVRLLSLAPATSDQFTKNLLKALVTSESVKNAGVSRLAIPRGWNSSHLFSREDAGIYIAHNPDALVMVSAPTPDIALTFGSSLHLTTP